jgi:hypothetical protein
MFFDRLRSCTSTGVPTDLSEAHVLLDGVHPVSDLCLARVHVGNHGAYVSDDRGEDQHADHKVQRDEHVFDVVHWLRGLA